MSPYPFHSHRLPQPLHLSTFPSRYLLPKISRIKEWSGHRSLPFCRQVCSFSAPSRALNKFKLVLSCPGTWTTPTIRTDTTGVSWSSRLPRRRKLLSCAEFRKKSKPLLLVIWINHKKVNNRHPVWYRREARLFGLNSSSKTVRKKTTKKKAWTLIDRYQA